MTTEEELFKGVPPFNEALGNLVTFATKALGVLEQGSDLWRDGDKALHDVTMSALRNLMMGTKAQQASPPEGHDPYNGRS